MHHPFINLVTVTGVYTASSFHYLLANEIAKGYSNATVRLSFRPSFRPSVTSL